MDKGRAAVANNENIFWGGARFGIRTRKNRSVGDSGLEHLIEVKACIADRLYGK